ncbi:uncharacterized protein [Paralichthys olivaceus]|uniref:uncharacterized protein isoform X2 n=1 Tax=Paralichthys olivaceus TaxID=8255 RepID=UPI003753988C
MAPLLFLLIMLPQIEAVPWRKVFFHNPGHDAVLPCDIISPIGSCSQITWRYNAAQNNGGVTVHNGFRSITGRAMSLDTHCSLLINNICDKDAGRYYCKLKSTGQESTPVILNVFTMSWFPADTVCDVVIQCSLERPFLFSSCNEKRFRWLDKGTGTVVSGENIQFINTWDRCVSSLTVDRGHNRSYTCQYVNGNMEVQIQADYTPAVKDLPGLPDLSGTSGPTDPTDLSGTSGPMDPTDLSGTSGPMDPTDLSGTSGPTDPTDLSGTSGPTDPTDLSGSSGPTDPTDLSGTSGPTDPTDLSGSSGWSPLSYTMLTVRVAILILLTIIIAVIIRDRGNKKPLEDNHGSN